jgi:hypothetical protein
MEVNPDVVPAALKMSWFAASIVVDPTSRPPRLGCAAAGLAAVAGAAVAAAARLLAVAVEAVPAFPVRIVGADPLELELELDFELPLHAASASPPSPVIVTARSFRRDAATPAS